MRDRWLSRQAMSLCLLSCASILWFPGAPARAADQDTVSTINHAFATELGTGVYGMGGRNIFVVRVTPRRALQTPAGQPRVRLVMPVAAGSFDFNPLDNIEAQLPRHIDSFSVMPGVELDLARASGWIATPWVRAGGSFSESGADGVLFGAGARLTWVGVRGGVDVNRLHEISAVNVDYRSGAADDLFLRVRSAIDLRRESRPVMRGRRLVPGLYAIADIVPDPPAVPLGAGNQTVVQMELGLTFNTEPRPRIGRWRWPRLGVGYRIAGDFSGWRLVVGAPF